MFDYGVVALDCELHQRQLQTRHEVRIGLSEDSLMKPFREMAGLPAPGEELGAGTCTSRHQKTIRGDKKKGAMQPLFGMRSGTLGVAIAERNCFSPL